MAIFERLVADRNELALGVCGSAGLCKPLDRRMPKDVLLSGAREFNQRFEIFVMGHGNLSGKGVITPDSRKAIFSAHFSLFAGADEIHQKFFLNLVGVF